MLFKTDVGTWQSCNKHYVKGHSFNIDCILLLLFTIVIISGTHTTQWLMFTSISLSFFLFIENRFFHHIIYPNYNFSSLCSSKFPSTVPSAQIHSHLDSYSEKRLEPNNTHTLTKETLRQIESRHTKTAQDNPIGKKSTKNGQMFLRYTSSHC